jgi:hypothetical protein
MLKRRDFLTAFGATAALLISRHPLKAELFAGEDEAFNFTSNNLELQLSSTAPQFLSLNVDGLGQGRRGANIVNVSNPNAGYKASSSMSSGTRRVEYRLHGAYDNAPASWTFELSGSRIVLTSEWSSNLDPAPLVLHFNLSQVHSTVLGLFTKGKSLAAPVLLHFPGQGSMRLTTSVPGIEFPYASDAGESTATLSLPSATLDHKLIVYTFDVTAIYPNVPGIATDPRFDAFRRNWLNALQLNPSFPALANNTASDTCAFCYYEFADIAAMTPPLGEGLTALDLVRQTLDRILKGGKAYGLATPGAACSDTFPSLIVAAANCVREGLNDAWLAANYDGIRGWTDAMLATDTDGNGLIKYGISGNSGIWPSGAPPFRPSNWWDTIGFGHEDAYANALAYRALADMAMMATRMHNSREAERYRTAATKLRDGYFQRFYDPVTGILGGWRSADGKLHNYYFLWVNGIAIHYGLVTRSQANTIMNKLMAKMREVGYNRFDMGLPGNLVSVALADCVDNRENGRYGCGVRPDNSDGFQKYENGGATGAFAFFTLAALYDLGRKAEADTILFAMLDEYGRSGFDQRGTNGMSNDWRQWNGAPWGYEGLLTDDYYALLAVPLRQAEVRWHSGFRPETTMT